MSEWSAQNWDPNENLWRVYSSINNCPVTAMPLCALEWRTFYFDKSWKQDQMKEKPNELYFSTSRPFKHKDSERVLKLGETRQLRAGFLIGTWERGNWGFTPTFDICLSDDGDCGQEESVGGAATTGTANQNWVGLDKKTCPKGSTCEGYTQKGTYKVATGANGDHKLTIEGALSWERSMRPRSREGGFGLFVVMEAGNE